MTPEQSIASIGFIAKLFPALLVIEIGLTLFLVIRKKNQGKKIAGTIFLGIIGCILTVAIAGFWMTFLTWPLYNLTK